MRRAGAGGTPPGGDLEALVGPVDLDALGRNGIASAGIDRPLRRDLHLFALGALAVGVTVAAAMALIDTPSRAGDPAPPSVAAAAPGPASTAELDAALRDQVGDRPESGLARALALPTGSGSAGGDRSALSWPAQAPSPDLPMAAPVPVEPEALRQARLADEAARRRADVLASPILAAVGGGRAGAGRGDTLAVPPFPSLPGNADPGMAVAAAGPGAGSGARIARGTVLPAVLLTEVRSDLPGTLIAQVTQTVWDALGGDRVLVPQGARLFGEYGSDLRPGRERLLAVFTRLVWPDGRALDLGRLTAVDAQGRSGLADEIDTRFAQRFGAGFMVAGLASLLAPRERQPATVVVVPAGSGTVSGLGGAAGTVLVETTRAILEQQRNAPPLVIVRQGHRFNVIVQDDLPVTADTPVMAIRAPAAETTDVPGAR
jgi:type IV secretory pathway VirB10-like protein